MEQNYKTITRTIKPQYNINVYHTDLYKLKAIAYPIKTTGPKGHCRSPEYNQRFKNLTSEWNQKQQHFILHVSRSLLCIRFVAITFWAEEVFEMCHFFDGLARVAIFIHFSARKKHKLGRGREDLASCQVSLDYVQRFQRKSQNMSQPIRGQGSHIVFCDQPEKHKLGRGRWELAFCPVSFNSVQWFQRRSRKCLSQSEDRAAILFF